MTTSKVEQDELPEYLSIFTLPIALITADGTGQNVLAAAGHHPKCRLTKLVQLTTIANAAPMDVSIEDGDGNDAAVGTGSTTLGNDGTVVYVYGKVFERDDAIIANVVDDGTAAGVLILPTFESID